MKIPDAAIEAELLRLADERGDKTFCPSEAARALDARHWRPLMPAIRTIAQRLVTAGQLSCTQRGQPVQPEEAQGPIRLARP